MKYAYQFTRDFETALDWVLRNQLKDNVFFRFTFESYSGDFRKSPWLSPNQCLIFMRLTDSDFVFKNFTMRVCA